jgi:hypothetical protein
MRFRVDPVVLRGAIGPHAGEYGSEAALSLFGLSVWWAVLVVWASCVALASRQGHGKRGAAIVGLTVIHAFLILVFHPNLLLVLWPNDASHLQEFVRWDVLRDIYFRWGLARQAVWVFGFQVVATFGILLLLTLRRGSKNRAAREMV